MIKQYSGWILCSILFRESLARTCAVLDGFKSPSIGYRPKFRYWLPDASVSSDAVVHDVKAIKDVGGGGMEFLPYYSYGLGDPSALPTDWSVYGFGQEPFNELFHAAVKASNETGSLFDFALGASQGQGVPAEPGTPGLAFELAYGAVTVQAGASFDGSLPPPDLDFAFLPGFMNVLEQFGRSQLIRVVAAGVKFANASVVVLDEESVVDLTNITTNGTLHWTAPDMQASYTLFALYERYTNQRSCVSSINATTINSNGSWIVDHFSAEGAKLVTDFWDDNIIDDATRQLLAAAGEYSWEDSIEMQAILYWTPSFLDKFQKNRGYDLSPYLPVLFCKTTQWVGKPAPFNITYVFDLESLADGGKYVADYEATLNEAYLEFLNHYRDWARSLGMEHSCQPASNLPLDPPGVAPHVYMPEIETLGFQTIDKARRFTGSVHLQGSNLVSSELGAVGTGAYTATIPSLLVNLNLGFASGVNVMVLHGYPYSGPYVDTNWPGFTALSFTYQEQWGERQPAWRHFKDTMDYTARSSLVTQTGVAKVDLAFYCAEFAEQQSEIYPGAALRSAGYTYEYWGPMNLASNATASANGVLAPDGPAYRALVMDSQTHITPAASARLLDIAASGVPIYILGSLPNTTIGKTGQEEVTSNMASLAQFSNVYRLPAHSTTALVDALSQARLRPRVATQGAAADKLYTYWRSDSRAGVDVIFMFNTGADATFAVEFNVGQHATPYVLDLWTGEQYPLLAYNRTRNGVATSISLKSNQTSVIGFVSRAPHVHVTHHSDNVYRFRHLKDGNIEALVDSGAALIQLSNGTQTRVSGIDSDTLSLRNWHLTVDSYTPADNDSIITQVTKVNVGLIEPLVPWTEIPGLMEVSGIGTYTTSFAMNAFRADRMAVIADFGKVLNTIRVWINEELIPPIDPTDPEADISNFVVKGTNTIRIEVASTLFNAIKSRIDTRISSGAGVAIPSYYTSVAYVPFGLIGPVTFKVLQRALVL